MVYDDAGKKEDHPFMPSPTFQARAPHHVALSWQEPARLQASGAGDRARHLDIEFAQDGVEEPPPVYSYASGSWGLAEVADQLVAGHSRWHGPSVTG
jgi:hypothetical protein